MFSPGRVWRNRQASRKPFRRRPETAWHLRTRRHTGPLVKIHGVTIPLLRCYLVRHTGGGREAEGHRRATHCRGRSFCFVPESGESSEDAETYRAAHRVRAEVV